MENALEKQIGGQHYKHYKMEPIELIVACKWDFIQGNIAKYLLRAKYKNGLEDIEKAKHYCELGKDLTVGKSANEIIDNDAIIKHFTRINQLHEHVGLFLRVINTADYKNLSLCFQQFEHMEKYFL